MKLDSMACRRVNMRSTSMPKRNAMRLISNLPVRTLILTESSTAWRIPKATTPVI